MTKNEFLRKILLVCSLAHLALGVNGVEDASNMLRATTAFKINTRRLYSEYDQEIPDFSPSPSPAAPAISLTHSASPSMAPTLSPTSWPSNHPTQEPTNLPTHEPTIYPTFGPTIAPTMVPTMAPTLSFRQRVTRKVPRALALALMIPFLSISCIVWAVKKQPDHRNVDNCDADQYQVPDEIAFHHSMPDVELVPASSWQSSKSDSSDTTGFSDFVRMTC